MAEKYKNHLNSHTTLPSPKPTKNPSLSSTIHPHLTHRVTKRKTPGEPIWPYL